jgi:hypothetical protein
MIKFVVREPITDTTVLTYIQPETVRITNGIIFVILPDVRDSVKIFIRIGHAKPFFIDNKVNASTNDPKTG